MFRKFLLLIFFGISSFQNANAFYEPGSFISIQELKNLLPSSGRLGDCVIFLEATSDTSATLTVQTHARLKKGLPTISMSFPIHNSEKETNPYLRDAIWLANDAQRSLYKDVWITDGKTVGADLFFPNALDPLAGIDIFVKEESFFKSLVSQKSDHIQCGVNWDIIKGRYTESMIFDAYKK